MPRHNLWTSGLLSAALAFASLPLAAQPPAPPPPAAGEQSLEQQMAELNRSVKTLVELLRVYLARQETDVLLQRIALGHRKLAPMETELRELRSKEQALDDERAQYETMLTEFEERAGNDSEDGFSEEDLAQMRQHFELQMKLTKDKRWKLEQRILELENRLEVERQDIDALEELVDERLGLR